MTETETDIKEVLKVSEKRIRKRDVVERQIVKAKEKKLVANCLKN